MPEPEDDDDEDEVEDDGGRLRREIVRKPVRRSKAQPPRHRSGVPVILGTLMFLTVLLVSAGATIFYMTKPPDDERLYKEGLKQLQNGQYAFAVKTLNDASALRPKDAGVFLALARAYIGVDQVDKAWDVISHAQQLGAGVAKDPALASELANFYRQHSQYESAVNLLRPLAKANIPGKRAELADLDAMWGDDALRDNNLDLALRCWEEVRDLGEGSRSGEAETRLATIYQRLANNYASDTNKDNDADALKYLGKLNNIAQNPKNFELAADLYERQGQLELAIDQMRKASKLAGHNPTIDHKLAALLSRRGKELLDEGNTDIGYGYLQQAKTVSTDSTLPPVALRNLTVSMDRYTQMPKIKGEVWNPTENSVNALTLKVELYDKTNSKVLWTKEQHIIDGFVPALGGHESKPFEMASEATSKDDGTAEFRVYMDGNLYKEYAIGEKKGGDSESETAAAPKHEPPKSESRLSQKHLPVFAPKDTAEQKTMPPTAPDRAQEQATIPPVAPAPQKRPPSTPPNADNSQTPIGIPTMTPKSGSSSAEEKTMKDLEQ